MEESSNLADILNTLHNNPIFSENISYWQKKLPEPAKLFPFPGYIHPELISSLQNNGISQLYSHQLESIDLISNSANCVISTGTASGKSLCYQVPILNQILKDGLSTALMLFPTKALTYDQLAGFEKLTPQSIRERHFCCSLRW